MIIQPTYAILRVVMTISNPGRPKMMAKRARGIVVFVCPGTTELIMRYIVKDMAAGRTRVPASSIPTTNCIEKQNVPQRSRTRTSSARLCTVELIQRRRWERRTLKVSGTTVLQTADGKKMFLRFGKVFNIKVVKYRSSPRSNKFFLCKVSTTFSE